MADRAGDNGSGASTAACKRPSVGAEIANGRPRGAARGARAARGALRVMNSICSTSSTPAAAGADTPPR
jgi:hypothetical protein